MESWKSHVRAALFHRDCKQKDPFSGLFEKVSRLEEMLDFHVKLWQSSSKENGHRCPNEDGTLYLRVNEVKFLNQQDLTYTALLKQKIADLTSNIYLKDAELQYCHSQVASYRTEAVLLAQGASCLKSDLEEYEYQLECQSKELTALRQEHSKLTEEMAATKLQKEELLDRWLEEKKQEAVRINKHNATQERWQRLAGRLKKRYRGKSRPLPFVAANTNSSDIKPTESNI